MPWNTIPTQVTGHDVLAAEWNDVADNMAYLERVGEQTFTSDVSVTGTSDVDIVSLGAITYEAVPHYLEFWASRVAAGASANLTVKFKDGATELGQIAVLAANVSNHTFYAALPITPTAASHTYKVAAVNTSSQTSTVNAGAGGSGVRLPGFIRITRVPT